MSVPCRGCADKKGACTGKRVEGLRLEERRVLERGEQRGLSEEERHTGGLKPNSSSWPMRPEAEASGCRRAVCWGLEF